MPVKKFTLMLVPKNVTMLMNGIIHKDLTNVITSVIVMVLELVTLKVGVKVKLDLNGLNAISQMLMKM